MRIFDFSDRARTFGPDRSHDKMGLGASAHAALAEDPCHGRDNPLEGGGERLDAHLAAASARLRAIRASFSWPYEAGDDPRGDGVALPLERMAEMLLPG